MLGNLRGASSRMVFWKSVFTDLESTGILRGLAADTPGRNAAFNAQVQVALTPVEKLAQRSKLSTLLRAAWAIVLARHTSSSDVLFYTSFDETEPRISPLRVVVA